MLTVYIAVKNFDEATKIMDIEETVKFGRENSACPYYLARAHQADADIIFLPYNYLVDATSRAAQNINVANCVLIFDEAHNLETSCGDVTSFELAPADLDSCIMDAQRCADMAGATFEYREYDAENFILLKCKGSLVGVMVVLLRSFGHLFSTDDETA